MDEEDEEEGVSYGEAGPLLCHVGDGEDSSFVTVSRLLSVSVVQQNALEAPMHRGEGHAQLHHLLMGICDGKEDPSPLSGWTHLRQRGGPISERLMV